MWVSVFAEQRIAAPCRLHLAQDEDGHLPLLQGELRKHATTVLLQGHTRGQFEIEAWRVEAGPARKDDGLMRVSGVIEGGTAGQSKCHAAADDVDTADEPLVAGFLLGDADGHEVGDLTDAIR